MSFIRYLSATLVIALGLPIHAEEVAPATEAVAPPAESADTLEPVVDTSLSTALPISPAAAETPSAPSTNVTVNLIARLVEKGILTREEATLMIQQAEAEAQQAQQAATPVIPEPSADEMRVTYIPEVVKNEMRDQIKQELMATARQEKWSEKNSPEWTSRLRPFGDLRVRYENTLFGRSNDNSGEFPNFNAINTGAPYNLRSDDYAPQYNVDQNRQRTRLRARVGSEIMLGNGFNAGLRLATGDSSSPTSPNQTLGGSGGNFSKYAIWLDRAFLSYEAGPGGGEELTFLAGRFDNPFFATDVQWDEDLAFDGLALRGKVKLTDKASTFFTAGYFPIFNTDFNFASNQPKKFESNDKWLTGAQLGIDFKVTDDLTAKLGVAYYDFSNVSGKLSKPFTPRTASDSGNTDSTRPGFAQRGNTYMALRDIVPDASNDFGKKNQFQYFGLASEFRNITMTGKIEYDHFDPVRISLLGELTKNVAFDGSAIGKKAVNNRGPKVGKEKVGSFDGGDMAWNLGFQIGKPAMAQFGDWQVGFGYRYVESDALIDGFTDSDFGGGGTNVRGYILGGSMALSPAVRLGVRWLSSDEIIGAPLSSDTLQFDLNAKF